MHIDDDKGETMRLFPEAALQLIDAPVDRETPPDDLDEALKTLVTANPGVRAHHLYRQLLGIARRTAS